MRGGLSWQQLRDLRCAELEEAADGWGRASNRADAARDRVDQQMLRALRGSEKGEAAAAAVKCLRDLSLNFQYVYTECGLVRTTLNSFANELKGPQRKLAQALDDAESLRFSVGADGSVTYPAAGENMINGEPLPGGRAGGSALAPLFALPQGVREPNPNAARANEIADRIAQAVREAVEIDATYTLALRKLTARDGLKVTAAMWTDASGDARTVRGLADEYLKDAIPKDLSPAQRKAWWDGLSQEAREEYLAVYPDQIGNLDGIPAAVRDAANRDNLQLLIGKLDGRDDERSQMQLAGLREIDRQLRNPGKLPVFLLGIGDEGNGRAIISYGNPNVSKNVSAYVPGLGTALDKEFAKSDLKRARDTAIGARKYDPSSAAIVWLGYDAPQFPDMDDPARSFEVMSAGQAERGAASYNSFMNGLVATSEHRDPHLTAIGHSYGSRTVGAATQHGGNIPGVDDIILVGSPGVGVDRADDLGVGKGHVFVGAAENDSVTKLPSEQQALLGTGGFALAGPLGAHMGAGLVGDDRWFGKDPASKAFGARRFKVADGPRPFIDGEMGIPAHSGYFDPVKDAESAENITRIVAGKPNRIRTDELR